MQNAGMALPVRLAGHFGGRSCDAALALALGIEGSTVLVEGAVVLLAIGAAEAAGGGALLSSLSQATRDRSEKVAKPTEAKNERMGARAYARPGRFAVLKSASRLPQ